MHYKLLGNDVLDQIIYRGEGNSSIVIALKTQAKVIRLLKKDGKLMRSSQDHHATQHPMRSIKFIHLIMKPLTDPYLSSATELIHLKSDFINSLSKRVDAYRPLHRLDKTLILDDQYALVMDDLCTLPPQITNRLQPDDLCGPTISVEIKPKQGFLPMHRLVMKSSVNDQFALKMRNCCIYGSTQYLKLARGRVNHCSNYCPINLFSGCPTRMKNALEELISNPQNNLRVFKDLALVYGESNQIKLTNIFDDFFETDDELNNGQLVNHHYKLPNEKRFVELLIQCLLNDHDKQDSELDGTSGVDNENSFTNSDNCLQHLLKVKCKRCDINPSTKKHKTDFATNHSSHRLPQSSVLFNVLRAQKLDSIGPHEALRMLNWLLEQAKSDKNDVLEELSKPQMPAGFGSLHQLPNETRQQYYFRKVWEFLVSLTAKDCSIIVTMRRISSGRYEFILDKRPDMRKHLLREQKTGNFYLFNVGIADLDQKMPLKIPRICDNLNLILQIRGDHNQKESCTTPSSQIVSINPVQL